MAQPEDRGSNSPKRGIIARIDAFFTRPSMRFGMGFPMLTGVVAGAPPSQSFLTFVEASSTNEFNASSHELESNVDALSWSTRRDRFATRLDRAAAGSFK